MYYVIEFDSEIDVQASGIFVQDFKESNLLAGIGERIGAFVGLNLPQDGVVNLRVATSFISLEQALTNLAQEIGWEIILYVYQNFRNDIKLETLAERFYLSVPHISTSFKPFIGDNFHHFLTKIRISHAYSMLISSNEPVTSLCFEVGFTSYATFSRVFQASLKMSPTSYRKLNSQIGVFKKPKLTQMDK